MLAVSLSSRSSVAGNQSSSQRGTGSGSSSHGLKERSPVRLGTAAPTSWLQKNALQVPHLADTDGHEDRESVQDGPP